MANYSILDGQITSNIYTNGVQAITGAVLQGVLLDMVNSLGKHYQFGGVALPAGVFTAGDENVAFFAYTAGTYTNYGGFTLDGKTLHVLAYKGTWTDTDTGIPTGAAVTQAISAALANYAKKDGIEPALVAGTAASLLGAPVEKIFQTYVARQSGRALIDQLKGNAIVWNQLFKGWTDTTDTKNDVTYSYVDGKLKVQGTASANVTNLYVGEMMAAGVVGHKYLITGPSTAADHFYLYFTPIGVYASGGTAIYTCNSVNVGNIAIRCNSGAVIDYEGYIQCYDLTALGIDTLTLAEAQAWIAANIGTSQNFDPAAGTVLPFCASSLQAQSGTEDLPLAPETWEDTDGNLIFPHGGMFAAGSAFDFAKVEPDGYIRRGTRVFAGVDLGTLNWTYSSSYQFFYATVSGIKEQGELICSIYSRSPVTGQSSENMAAYLYSQNMLRIKNTAYTDAAAFKTAMSGVMLYYELATPVEKTLAQPVNVLFVQAAGENVSLDPANGDTPYTAAARMDLREPDAVSAGTLQNLLEELKTAGVISAYTMTWDAASGTYQFTVTA